MNGEYITAPDELPDGGFSGSAMPMPVASMSDQQYMQAALAAPTPPAPGVTMAAGPVITKAAPPMPMDDAGYGQAALGAAAGPGPEAAYAQRAVDVSVMTPANRVVGYAPGSAGRETIAILPKAREALDKADSAVETAGFKSQLNAMQSAEAEADFMHRQAVKAEYRRGELEDAKLHRSAELQNKADDISKTSEELARFRVDPAKTKDNRSTGGRIFDGLTAGLLSLGGKSIDPLMKRIESEKENSLEAQKIEYANRLQGLKGKETVYELMMKKYGTEDDAEAATRAAGMDEAKNELAALSAEARGGDAQAAFGEMQGQLEAKKQRDIAAHVKMTAGRAPTMAVQLGNGVVVQQTQAQYNADAVASDKLDKATTRTTGAAVATEGAKQKTEGVKESKKDEKDERQRFVATDDKGGGYLAPTVEEAKGQREQRAGISDMRKQLNAIKAEREKLDFGDKASGLNPVYSSPRVRKLESMSSSLLTTMNKGKGLGALDNGSLKVLGEQIGKLSTVNPLSDPTPNIESLLAEAERSLQTSESGSSGYTQTAPTGAKQGWGK